MERIALYGLHYIGDMRINKETKKLRHLPRLNIAVGEIMRKVDANRDLVGFPSLIRGIAYATDGKDALIISSSGGYLRIDAEHLPTLTAELVWISEEIERRNRD